MVASLDCKASDLDSARDARSLLASNSCRCSSFGTVRLVLPCVVIGGLLTFSSLAILKRSLSDEISTSLFARLEESVEFSVWTRKRDISIVSTFC